MGAHHKKRNATHHVAASKGVSSPTASATTSRGVGFPNGEELNGEIISLEDGELRVKTKETPKLQVCSSSIRADCEKALVSLRRGNPNKALRLMKEACSRHMDVALVHRVHGTISVKMAGMIEDPNVKQRHLKNAIDSAKKAVSLSPNSVEFAHFYANLLYEGAKEGRGFEDVVRECERALAIDDPIDPAKESLQDESQQKLPTSQDRIAHVQQELRSLIQKTNIASLSSWVKHLGNGVNGEEKIRLIPMRRLPVEDPMEVKLVQGRRPNEIKKVNKTPEERRQEIEVRVAAARLIQQKLESPPPASDHRSLAAPPGPQRGESRRRSINSKKSSPFGEKMEQIRSYWMSLDLENKKQFREISISDLKQHCTSLASFWPSISSSSLSKEKFISINLFLEAISFAENHRSWKFWACCRCGEKFADDDTHMQHVIGDHMGNLTPRLQSVLPQEIDTELVGMLLSGSWKPIHLNDALKLLVATCGDSQFEEEVISQSAHGDNTTVGETSFKLGNNMQVENECAKETESLSVAHDLETLLDKVVSGSKSCNGAAEDFSDPFPVGDENKVGHECEERNSEGHKRSKALLLSQEWPLEDDVERLNLLEKISSSFHSLIKHKCLAGRHLNKVIQYVIEELQGLMSDSSLNHLINSIPLCVCFLSAVQLQKVLKFLQEICISCGINRYTEKNNSVDVVLPPHDDCIDENIFLCADSSCLLLDAPYAKTSNSFATIEHESTDMMFNPDSLLPWIFSIASSPEQLNCWDKLQEEKSQQGLELLQMLEKEFYLLQSLCERKCEHLNYEEAFNAVEALCIGEIKKRELVGKSESCGYETILRKRQVELVESHSESPFFNDRREIEVIGNIFKEVQTLNVSQFGYDDNLTNSASRLCDIECGDDSEWRIPDFIHQMDSCIEVAIQRQKEQLSLEINKMDARILRHVSSMQNLEVRLGSISSSDYRPIVVPLVKSFLKAHLEDLVEKNATEKANAAREAFLAELAEDARKDVNRSSEGSKQAHEKLKDKKKNKDYKRVKGLKVPSADEQLLSDQEISESITQMPSSIQSSASDNDAKLQEEEDYWRIQLEAEERKLEETLEFQRRIEEEAKQKLFAGQSKQAVENDSGWQPESLSSYDFSLVTSGSISKHDQKLVSLDDSQSPMFRTLCNGTDSDCHALQGDEPYNANTYLNNGIMMVGQEAVSPRSDLPSLCTDRDTLAGQDVQKANDFHGSDGSVKGDGALQSTRKSRKKVKQKTSATYHHAAPVRVSSNKENHATVDTLKAKDVPYGTNGLTFADTGLETAREINQSDPSGETIEDGSDNLHHKEVERKTLRQLHVEKDEEERFQADLQKAVQESLDTFQTHGKFPLVPASRLPKGSPTESDFSLYHSDGSSSSNEHSTLDVLGAGLQNEVGEYNCFLNVIIQSLWHIKRFRNGFFMMSRSGHMHVGDPCVVCSLHDIFSAFNTASTDSRVEVISPTSLRIALSNLYPASNFLQEAQMNDASEVLDVIFDCLHRSYTADLSKTKADGSSCSSSFDCTEECCLVHSLFAMNIHEGIQCYSCFLESRHLKYTSFCLNINANSLRTMKITYTESSFDELLKREETNNQLNCDTDIGGCGTTNCIRRILVASPHVFTIILGWQKTCESLEDISATLSAIDTLLDVGVIYDGIDIGSKHYLVSVVCYYGQHYHSFAYNHEHKTWVMYDDQTVKIIGSWDDVLSLCKRGHMQPQVLFYEAAE